VQQYLTDDEYGTLQQSLIVNPEAGDVIPGSGGVRKLRWGVAGRGKRDGLRVICFLRLRQGEIWMLTLYAKRFAELLEVSVRTLQEWEQGRRAPSGAARTLLLIADRNPHALLDVA